SSELAENPQLDCGLLGSVLRESRAIRVAAAHDARVDCGLPHSYPPVESLLAVPIASLQRTYGWICLGRQLAASRFSPEDEHLLTILGAQVGRVYENGTLYREVQKYASELLVEIAERERVVAELSASEQRFR